MCRLRYICGLRLVTISAIVIFLWLTISNQRTVCMRLTKRNLVMIDYQITESNHLTEHKRLTRCNQITERKPLTYAKHRIRKPRRGWPPVKPPG